MGKTAKLTYSVELEFVVAVEKRKSPIFNRKSGGGSALPACEEGKAYGMIVDLLGSHCIPAILDCQTCGSDQILTRVAKGYDLELAADLEIRHQFWQVKSGISAFMPDTDPRSNLYHWISVELTSPVYDDWQDFRRDVKTVCDLLRQDLLCEVNRSTGCHVHISERQPNGVSLNTAKKTVGLYCFLEPMLLGLCSPHRSEIEWCKPMSRSSNLFYYLRPGPFCDDPEDMGDYVPESVTDHDRRQLAGIFSQGDFAGLAALISNRDSNSSSPHLAFAISTTYAERLAGRLREPAPDAGIARYKRTMEARSLQGTLDPELICQWTKLLLYIVSIAQQDNTAYRTILGQVVEHARNVHGEKPYKLEGFLEDCASIVDSSFDVSQTTAFWDEMLEVYRRTCRE